MWLTRQIVFLMRASKGGLTHEQIMRLTWRQFGVYLDAFTWILREESEEGRRQNRTDDLRAMSREPRLKDAKKRLLDDTKRDLEKHKRFAEQNTAGGGVKHSLLE